MIPTHSLPLVLLLLAQDPPAAPAGASDPFRADAALDEVVPSGQASGELVPLDAPPAMPAMRVRGVVKMADRPRPAAILEVEGVGRYCVREGERVSFSLSGRAAAGAAPAARARPRDGIRGAPPDPGAPTASVAVRQQLPVVLRVEEIARDGVVVEVGTLGERLIIR